ncbi:hypothetical protein [Streptomyces tubercidicus]
MNIHTDDQTAPVAGAVLTPVIQAEPVVAATQGKALARHADMDLYYM